MKNIINSILIGTAVLGLSACSLHDDTELFGEPAAERLEKNGAADKTLLESAANGWGQEKIIAAAVTLTS